MPRYNPQRVRLEPVPTPVADYVLGGLVFLICAGTVAVLLIAMGR